MVKRPLKLVQTRVKTKFKVSVKFAVYFKSVRLKKKNGHTEGDINRLTTSLLNKKSCPPP